MLSLNSKFLVPYTPSIDITATSVSIDETAQMYKLDMPLWQSQSSDKQTGKIAPKSKGNFAIKVGAVHGLN